MQQCRGVRVAQRFHLLRHGFEHFPLAAAELIEGRFEIAHVLTGQNAGIVRRIRAAVGMATDTLVLVYRLSGSSQVSIEILLGGNEG